MMQIGFVLSIFILIFSVINNVTANKNDPGQFLVSKEKNEILKSI
jgi:hypothetical protein